MRREGSRKNRGKWEKRKKEVHLVKFREDLSDSWEG